QPARRTGLLAARHRLRAPAPSALTAVILREPRILRGVSKDGRRHVERAQRSNPVTIMFQECFVATVPRNEDGTNFPVTHCEPDAAQDRRRAVRFRGRTWPTAAD